MLFFKELRRDGTKAAAVICSCPQAYSWVLPGLEFVSYFLSSKKHVFHAVTSLKWECTVHRRRLQLDLRGLPRRPGHCQPEASSHLKSLLEGFFGHTGGVNSDPKTGLVVQILRRAPLPLPGLTKARRFPRCFFLQRRCLGCFFITFTLTVQPLGAPL